MKKRHWTISILLTVLFLLMFCGTALADGITGENWMSQLPDNAPLGQVNLPGSGDSLSTLSQDMTIAEQLETLVSFLM